MYQSADQAYYVPHARDFEGQGMVSPTGGRSGKRGQTPFSEACPRQAGGFTLSINVKRKPLTLEKLGLCAKVFLDACFFTFRWAVDFCSSGGARAGDVVAGWGCCGCGYGK